MDIFKIEHLTYFYAGTEVPALKDINMTVREGEFMLLLGSSGSGKSTLGRVFNKIVPDFYGGRIAGRVEGQASVGMVFQDPEKQLVMDKVERELAFPLENLGMPYEAMRKRVMETLSFLNIHGLKEQKTYCLSGGQKQKVAVGSILAMGHRCLVLDEPTSQLDPSSAEEILNLLKALNEELGYTIILIEQRVERCFHLADRVLFMEKGQILFDGKPRDFARDKEYAAPGNGRLQFLPPVARFFVHTGHNPIPLTVKEGRQHLGRLPEKEHIKRIIPAAGKTGRRPQGEKEKDEAVIVLKDLVFTYNNDLKALKKISLTVRAGEVLAVMGESGSGKSTLLKNIAGLLQPSSGTLEVKGGVGYLSQDPNDYLFNDTVYEELKYTMEHKGIRDEGRIREIAAEMEIDRYLDMNPRDLSGGERQRVALAAILVMQPQILILDEPTRGLDRILKAKLGAYLRQYAGKGHAVVVVTHDVEFAAAYCHRACLLFDGVIAQTGDKYEVLTSGLHYSTQMNRLFQGRREGILTVEDGLETVKNEGEGAEPCKKEAAGWTAG